VDVRQLEYFREVAETGGFSRAANRIRISQSALSRQIMLLEEELGAKLLERHARGVHLTEVGRLLYERVDFLLRHIANMREEIIDRRDWPTGALHVGIPRSMRTLLSKPAIARFMQDYPGVFFRFVEDTSALVRDKLLRGELDLGLLSIHEPASALESRPLLKEQMFLVGPPSAGLSLDRAVELRSLAELKLVGLSRPASLRVALEKAASAQDVALNIRAEINATIALDLVSQGLGYTVYSYCGLHDHLVVGRISAAPITGFDIEWMLASSKERPLTQAIKIFEGMLREQAARAIGSGDWRTAVLV
jgi:LysR family nitrogen assimilation transcriptional regulator